jgi:multiple sugar transport system permease protein
MSAEQYALTVMQWDVQTILDEILEPPPPHVVNWTPYFVAYGSICAAPFGLMYLQFRRKRREYGWRGREVGAAMLFASPWIVGMITLVGGPIIFSVIFSFTRYDVLSPARYVGLENYAAVFRDPVFYTSLWNTAYMILRIPLVMAVSLAIAMLLNRAIRGIGFYRTAFYMPAIMPLVASSLLWWWLFNPSYGAINQTLAWIFATAPAQWIESFIGWITQSEFRFTLPLWLNDRNWSKPSLILMNLWTAGGGMIIWLAGLQAIPQQLYEAASIDGANAWKRFRHVTIPMLSPYILFNLIIGLIGTMQIFAEAFIMTAGGPADSTLFYAYYLFRQAFQYFRMGYASAMAWILFLIVLMLTLTQLWLSKKWVHYDQV